jgi:drug/metabolite transporter (DMT)-like permease
VAALLGVFVAAAFGTGDFLGGRASSRASVTGTLVISQAVGLLGAVVLAAFAPGSATASDFGLGALSGIGQVLGLALLYRGLALHTAGVVAPITAVVATALPVAWGLVHGERPSALALVGVVLAALAGLLIAREEDGIGAGGGWAAGALDAVAAGIAFGVSLVLLSETSRDADMWPVLGARTAAALAVWTAAVLLLARGRPPAIPRAGARTFACAAGLCDVAGTAAILLAVRRGLLVLVAPVAALAPGFTVLLAWVYLGERLGRLQQLGIAFALVGVVLVARG